MIVYLDIFRAIDDLNACKEFMDGHEGVLRSFGITKVTSANTDWFNNPQAYVIVARAEDGELIGGIRLHIHNKTHPLPLVKAIEHKDPKVNAIVAEYAEGKTGEICGLWNSRKVKGKGVSALLMQAIVIILEEFEMTSLLGLCSPYTKETLQSLGFTLEKRLGDNGEFNYPNEDLVATSIVIPDPLELNFASTVNREMIFSVRNNIRSRIIEKIDLGELEFVYNFNKQFDSIVKF